MGNASTTRIRFFFDGRLPNYRGHCFMTLPLRMGIGDRKSWISKTKSADNVNASDGVAGDATVTNSGERTRPRLNLPF
jgi:hypothetical protein